MKPYYDDGKGIVIYHGDCREILSWLGKIDAVVTDPPYGVEAAKWDGRVPHELVETFLKQASGPVFWFGSAPLAIKDAKAFQTEPDRMMIWAPKFTLSKTAKDGYAFRYHPIWCWRLHKQKNTPWDVFDDATECGNWWEHKCSKPITLMKRLVAAAAEPLETILDAFMGSGTTLVAAKALGRHAIGIEIEEKYCAIAVKRLEQECFVLTESIHSQTQFQEGILL